MNKIPVGEAVRFAYEFTFRELGTIIGLIWVPMVALAVINFLPYALGDMTPSPDINPTAAGSDAGSLLSASGNNARAAVFKLSPSRRMPSARDMKGRTAVGSGDGQSPANTGFVRRWEAPATPSATKRAHTTASVKELLASLLAPCNPVEATSPQAQRPETEVRPEPSTATPPIW